MTTANTSSDTPKVRQPETLPDIPDREPDEVTQYDQLFHQGLSNDLRVHLGNYESTLVGADHWIAPDADFDQRRARYPDLLVAFDVDPEVYRENNGYVVSEQVKAPVWVLEVASESTGENDVGDKREYYQVLGIPDYWRFDETGEHHGEKLAGDVLVEGRYEPVEIQELPGGALQGYSRALGLYLRWEEGQMVPRDPATGEPIATLESERARAEAERKARLREQARADTAEARASSERESRIQADAPNSRADTAEARNRELEEELRRLRGND